MSHVYSGIIASKIGVSFTAKKIGPTGYTGGAWKENEIIYLAQLMAVLAYNFSSDTKSNHNNNSDPHLWDGINNPEAIFVAYNCANIPAIERPTTLEYRKYAAVTFQCKQIYRGLNTFVKSEQLLAWYNQFAEQTKNNPTLSFPYDVTITEPPTVKRTKTVIKPAAALRIGAETKDSEIPLDDTDLTPIDLIRRNGTIIRDINGIRTSCLLYYKTAKKKRTFQRDMDKDDIRRKRQKQTRNMRNKRRQKMMRNRFEEIIDRGNGSFSE